MEDHYTQRFKQLGGVDLWLTDAPALGRNGSYGAVMYAEHLVGALGAHDYSTPVFSKYLVLGGYTRSLLPQPVSHCRTEAALVWQSTQLGKTHTAPCK